MIALPFTPLFMVSAVLVTFAVTYLVLVHLPFIPGLIATENSEGLFNSKEHIMSFIVLFSLLLGVAAPLIIGHTVTNAAMIQSIEIKKDVQISKALLPIIKLDGAKVSVVLNETNERVEGILSTVDDGKHLELFVDEGNGFKPYVMNLA